MAIPLFGALSAIAALSLPSVHAAGTTSYNGLAVTPQMGWDNWNAFGCKVDEDLLLSSAQKIVDFGLRDLGTFFSISSSGTILISGFYPRILLYHSGRLLVRWTNIKWHIESQCHCLSQWYAIRCRSTPQHGSWVWHVFVRWHIHMCSICCKLGL